MLRYGELHKVLTLILSVGAELALLIRRAVSSLRHSNHVSIRDGEIEARF